MCQQFKDALIKGIFNMKSGVTHYGKETISLCPYCGKSLHPTYYRNTSNGYRVEIIKVHELQFNLDTSNIFVLVN